MYYPYRCGIGSLLKIQFVNKGAFFKDSEKKKYLYFQNIQVTKWVISSNSNCTSSLFCTFCNFDFVCDERANENQKRHWKNDNSILIHVDFSGTLWSRWFWLWFHGISFHHAENQSIFQQSCKYVKDTSNEPQSHEIDSIMHWNQIEHSHEDVDQDQERSE